MKAKNSILVTNLIFLFQSQFESGSAGSISPLQLRNAGREMRCD